MARIENRKEINRIVYIDPNDAHDHYGIHGNQAVMTPDYTDMTLWCNLIVETSSRLKNQGGGTDSSGVYYINFDMTKAANGSDYVSFLQGADVDRYNYLTTSYTDFDFNEIRRKNMIEGLLIEDITINMANFTCPQVKMKFVDVRGAGFFGREETTHNAYGNLTNLEMNKNGKLMDNFYNCFVCFPYPRFKLQIKGFYGKPVTYQLTCSNFEGNFNASTGNFELNVQFIGYEYGVLGDIPFDYIVAAPLTKIGGDYWDKQVEIAQTTNSNEWLLATNEPPCKLFDFYSSVESAIEEAKDSDINEILLSDDANTTISQGDKQIEMLTNIMSNIDRFKQVVRDRYKYYVTEVCTDTDEYMVIHSSVQNGVLSQEMADAYNLVGNSIDEYTELFYESKVNSTLIPNGGSDGYWYGWEYGEVVFDSFTSYQNNNNDIGSNVIVARNGNVVSGERISNASSCIGVSLPYYNSMTGKDCAMQSDMTISEALSEQLYKNYNDWEWCLTGRNYAGYAAVINFKGITSILKERILEIRVKLNEYQSEINKGPSKTIKDLVGFSPYVANYFKVVMCHLETFVYLFNSTADSIQQQMNYGVRTPANLGICNVDYQTDVPSSLINSNKQVPHFPSVYKKYSIEEEIINTTPDSKDIVASAWIGDFKGSLEWEEQKLVDDLYNALQRIITDRSKSEANSSSKRTNIGPKHFSLFGQDVFRNIPSYSYQNKDNLAFYTGVRAEAIFGIYNYGLRDGQKDAVKDDYASKFGAIDALNLVNQCTNKSKLADLVKVSSNGESLAEELYNIVTNNNSGQSNTYSFELVKVTNDRQPVFVKDGDKLNYRYMPCDNNTAIIPMDNFTKFSNSALKLIYNWQDKQFKTVDKDNPTYMFTDTAETLVKYNDDVPSTETDKQIFNRMKGYTNSQMFDIFNGYNSSYVDTTFGCKDLLVAYDEFSKGTNQVGSMTGDKFVEVTNEYWLMDNYCLTYFKKKRNSCKNYKDLGIIDDNLVRADGTIPSSLSAINTMDSTEKFINDFISKV